MQVQLEEVRGMQIVKCSGELTSGGWFDRFFRDLNWAQSSTLVFDMAEVGYVNSSGVRRLLEIQSAIARQGGTVVVMALQQSVREVFEHLGLFRLFSHYRTLGELIAAKEAEEVRKARDQSEEECAFVPGEPYEGSLEGLAAVLDQARHAVWLKDAAGNLVYANPAGQTLYRELSSAPSARNRYRITEYTLPLEGGKEPATLFLFELKVE